MSASEKKHSHLKNLILFKILYLLKVVKISDKLGSKKFSFTMNKFFKM